MGKFLRFVLGSIASAILIGAAAAMLSEPFWQKLYQRLGVDSSKWVDPMIDSFSVTWVQLVLAGIVGSAVGAWLHWMASGFDSLKMKSAQTLPTQASQNNKETPAILGANETECHWRVEIGGDVAYLDGVSVVANADNILVVSTDKRDSKATSDGVRVDCFGLGGDANAAFGLSSGYSTFRLNGLRSAVARMSLLSDGSALIVGTAYDDQTNQSSAFMATVTSDGSLGTRFPGGIFSARLGGGKLTYGWDALRIGNNFYFAASIFDNPALYVIKVPADEPAAFEVFDVRIKAEGMIWPKIVRQAFPEDAIYVAGRLIGASGTTSDGFVAKVKPTGGLDRSFAGTGWVSLQSAFGLDLIHSIVGLEVLANGTVIIAGTGNDGFVAALDAQGEARRSFGTSGVVKPRGLYSTEPSSLSISQSQRAITLGGTESDGNSISRPFVLVMDMDGRPKANVRGGIVYVETGAKAQMRDHVILPEGRIASLIHEGDFLRQAARVALVGQKLP